MEMHKKRLSAVVSVLDTQEPEHIGRLAGPNPKRVEQEREKRFEIEAENARMAQRIFKIDDQDPSKLIRPSTSRSTFSVGSLKSGVPGIGISESLHGKIGAVQKLAGPLASCGPAVS
eukprot:gene23329-30573_t